MEKSTMSVQDLARQMGISLPKAYARHPLSSYQLRDFYHRRLIT